MLVVLMLVMLVVVMMKYDGFPLFTFVRAREPQMCRHDLLLHSNAFSLHRCGRYDERASSKVTEMMILVMTMWDAGIL